MIKTDRLSTLLNDLALPNAEERRAAAEALGEADERAVYPLIRALRDENPGVQDAAMRSLMAIGGEATAYMVLPLLRDEPNLRNTALLILKEIGPATVPLLRVLLDDRDEDIRKFAIDLIGDIKTCDYPEELVRLLESDPNPNVRAAAAKAVAILDYRDAIPALIHALKDDEWVCFSALEGLSQFADASALEPIGALLSSPSGAVRYAAIEAIGKIGSPKAGGILHDYLGTAEEMEMNAIMEKNAVIRSLVQVGLTPAMTGVADSLMNMLVRGDWEERLIAVRGLADIRVERAIPAIIDIAGSLEPTEPVNEDRLYEIRQALHKFGCAKALIDLLQDPALKYRGKVIAIENVAEIGCTDALPHLIPLLKAKSTHVVLAAVDAVARLAGGDAGAILTFLREHADAEVRNRVARLLETKE